MNKTTAFLITLIATFDTAVASETYGCEKVLVTTEVNWAFDNSVRLSILKLVDRQTFNTDKSSIGGGLEIPVDEVPLSGYLNYDDFSEARSRDFERSKFEYDYDEAQTYLTSYLPENVTRAFTDCLRNKSQSNYGIHLIQKEISPDYVSFDVYWNAPPDVGDVDVSEFRVFGAAAGADINKPTKLKRGAYLPIDIERDSKKPFRFILGAGGYPAVRLSVPLPLERPEEQKEPYEIVGFRPRLEVLVHQQTHGDLTGNEGDWVGLKGQRKRLEGFQVSYVEPIPGLQIEYLCHVQSSGDTKYLRAGEFCGTRGQSRRIEGFAIRLEGPLKSSFSVKYGCHVESLGDVYGLSDNAYCGTRGQSRRIESMVVVVERIR